MECVAGCPSLCTDIRTHTHPLAHHQPLFPVPSGGCARTRYLEWTSGGFSAFVDPAPPHAPLFELVHAVSPIDPAEAASDALQPTVRFKYVGVLAGFLRLGCCSSNKQCWGVWGLRWQRNVCGAHVHVHAVRFVRPRAHLTTLLTHTHTRARTVTAATTRTPVLQVHRSGRSNPVSDVGQHTLGDSGVDHVRPHLSFCLSLLGGSVCFIILSIT
jgi:hypothetical protein